MVLFDMDWSWKLTKNLSFSHHRSRRMRCPPWINPWHFARLNSCKWRFNLTIPLSQITINYRIKYESADSRIVQTIFTSLYNIVYLLIGKIQFHLKFLKGCLVVATFNFSPFIKFQAFAKWVVYLYRAGS